MISSDEIRKIKEITEDLLKKMTITDFDIEPQISSAANQDTGHEKEGNLDIVNLNIKIKEPQILIGSNGQTLFELERILRIILNKKLGKFFYLELDINNYKKKKIEYLKDLAKNLANEVALTKKSRILSPMPSYQRRIIHIELAQRQDIKTESAGDGADRYIIINPR